MKIPAIHRIADRYGLHLLLGVLMLSILLGTTLGATPVLAQGGDDYPQGVDPDEVYRIARSMYCDVCAGVPLADCPSPQCQAWREEIADLLAQGYTADEIRTHFAARYGEKVSGVPLSESNRRLTYAIPIGLALLAAGLVIWQIRYWSRRQDTTGQQAAQAAGLDADFERPVPDNVDPVYLERLLRLLDKDEA